jgi:hypothetical protein
LRTEAQFASFHIFLLEACGTIQLGMLEGASIFLPYPKLGNNILYLTSSKFINLALGKLKENWTNQMEQERCKILGVEIWWSKKCARYWGLKYEDLHVLIMSIIGMSGFSGGVLGKELGRSYTIHTHFNLHPYTKATVACIQYIAIVVYLEFGTYYISNCTPRFTKECLMV